MKKHTANDEAVRNYEAAHMVHYQTKDLHEALGLYKGVMASHPDTPEAGYSRTQIQNIAKSVVPKQELLDAEIELVLTHLDKEEPINVKPGTPVGPQA